MKLIDKIKDLFMDEIVDEEDDEDSENDETVVTQKKETSKDVLPKVMRETIRKEEKVELKVKPEDFVKTEKKQEPVTGIEQEKEPVKKFNFPFDFETDVPSRDTRHNSSSGSANVNVLRMEKEVPKKISELYQKKDEIKPKFKASPVISPVYGVLDKNYTKEEVKERDEEMVEMKRPSKKVDFETVRKKAFGNLADDIKDNLMCENCELYKEVKKISALKEDDLLYEMTVDEEKDVTIEKAYDNYKEFGVAYEPKNDKKKFVLDEEKVDEDMDTTSLVEDTNEIKQEDTVQNDSNISNDVEYEEKVDAALEEKNSSLDDSIPSREEKKKETKVDDDFFELIDSMYKERIDE